MSLNKLPQIMILKIMSTINLNVTPSTPTKKHIKLFSMGRHVKIKSCLAVDREFMYIGSADPGRADGRADGGRTGGRADGRAAGTILNDSTTIFIDFHKKHKKAIFFLTFRIVQKRTYRVLQLK